MTGQVIILFLNLISITLAARFLGVEDFGRFSALLAIITIISKAFDLGFPAILFRELSLKREQIYLLNTSIILTIILFLITALVFNVTVFILNVTVKEIVLLNVLLANTLLSIKFTNMRELLQTPFKVDLKMHIPISIAILDNILFLSLIFLIPIFEGGLTLFIIIYVVSNLPGFITMFILLFRKYSFKLKFDIKNYLWLFKEAVPVYGYLVFDALLQQTDILFLKKFHGDYAVGVYSIALRYVLPLIFIPSAIIQSLLPSITRNREQKSEKNVVIFNLTLKLFFFIASSIALIVFFKSEEIIVFILGSKYIETAVPFSVLFLGQFFVYFNFFSFNMFIAYGRQRTNFLITVLLFIITFILNIIFIPLYSFIGASWIRFFTYFIETLIIYKFLLDIKLEVHFFNIKTLLWLVGLTFSLYLLSNLTLAIYIAGSAIITITLTIVFKYFNLDDIRMFLNLINQEKLLDKTVVISRRFFT